ncbi:FAD-dependent oxidoreductase [Engelhardtia mirabilis]|uniref:Aerobic glycerol-3-phosphate dehydrogenase n=1 Tax=Engelhardtia mirabilis TaxID=2528011 RepID=A0A518BRJ6_9BACT|nr:Aerobic glycerol-3-phosphate dehydrogenase [Planctomycetes bacterium Pla133]QDV03921.1 Aerobic glycerol-3-phosphate dehydrogenase [Planctomycetes bacterium Pla86]
MPVPQPTAADSRASTWDAVQGTFDVAIVGGGVGGAAVFSELARRGYRCLLVDRGDFASGTSQASGMLVWGGLLYLRRLELATVVRLSRARDELLLTDSHAVRTAAFRFFTRPGGRHPWMVRGALEAYWLLGAGRRGRPRRGGMPGTRDVLAPDRFGRSYSYEEGYLATSDARLTLDWILAASDGERVAINHAELVGADRSAGRRPSWELELVDRRTGHARTARARTLVVAAGVWADDVARRCQLATRHRHVFSKGVYLGLPRPQGLEEFLAIDMGRHGDTLTLTPWGPIALWGPTETGIETIDEGLAPTRDDVRFLLDAANENLAGHFTGANVVSLRCGIRPLAVPDSYDRKVYPLDLSRRCVVDVDAARGGLTLYGGKITSARDQARRAAHAIGRLVEPTGTPAAGRTTADPPITDLGLGGHASPVVDPEHARDHESCATLDDYLRRRTTIAQWIPRLGLGRADENRATLQRVAGIIEGADRASAAVDELADRARAQDDLLGLL